MSEVMNETMVETTPEVNPKSINDLTPKMMLTGAVTRLELYGAFIDLGVGVNALIHISQLGKEHVNRVADVLKVGDEVNVWVDKVDPQREQIMVTMIQPLAVDWKDLKVGQVHTGQVSRLENFGAFVNIGAEREGLVHISELSHDYIKNPSEVVKVGDEVQTQVLGFSKRKRRIDLSIKALLEKQEQTAQTPQQNPAFFEYEEEENDDMPTAMEIALRAAMGDDMPSNRSKKGKKNNKKRYRRERSRQQDEILDRTLHG